MAQGWLGAKWRIECLQLPQGAATSCVPVGVFGSTHLTLSMTHTDSLSDGLKGKRVLVVEDEAVVAMLLEDMLGDLGCVAVGPAMTLKLGTELAQKEKIDVAILDVNVAGERVYPIAEILAVREVPMIFATGYGEGGLQDPWRGRPTVQKPYTEGDIVRALQTVFTP